MRLIDADELVRNIDELSKDAGFYRAIYNGFSNVISRSPTIEAEPVRHGRWVSDEVDVLFHCSVCETQISTSWDYDCDEMWNYCPKCGAKMDGEAHE